MNKLTQETCSISRSGVIVEFATGAVEGTLEELHTSRTMNYICFDTLPNLMDKYHICSIRHRSHLVAAYNSVAELKKIVAALE